MYNELVVVLKDIILRAGQVNDPGALGTVLALLGVTEGQGRGGLHLHASGWGKITADDITRHADDDDVVKEIIEMVKSFVTGEVMVGEVTPGWGEEVNYKRERVWYTKDIPTAAKDIAKDASRINSVVNHHGPKCYPTCEPSRDRKDPTCRMARPAPPIFRYGFTELTLDATADEFKLHRCGSLSSRRQRK